MIVTTKELFAHAHGKYAIGAYNINNLEQTMGLFKGNVDSKALFIVQLSKGARSYTPQADARSHDGPPTRFFRRHLRHSLDHGDEATCMDCINSGVYSSVMIDASHEPLKEHRNHQARGGCRSRQGHCREAELGPVKGVEEDIVAAEHVYTKPEEAEYFVKQTGCDSLAAAIGTSHGAFKFKGDQKLRFDILEEIQRRLPNFPLVLHGSSSVPQDEVARINAAGGNIRGASGVDASQFLGAAKLGVAKINIDTDGRLVWCRVHREFFRDHPEKFDLRDPGKVFMPEYAKFIAGKNVLLGSAGQLDSVREYILANKK